MNDKLKNFERLAEKRVTDTLKKIKLIGNLSNKSNYDYTDKHVKEILEVLDEELKNLKRRFSEEGFKESKAFSFKK